MPVPTSVAEWLSWGGNSRKLHQLNDGYRSWYAVSFDGRLRRPGLENGDGNFGTQVQRVLDFAEELVQVAEDSGVCGGCAGYYSGPYNSVRERDGVSVAPHNTNPTSNEEKTQEGHKAGEQMRVSDIQAGKTYYGRRGGRSHRTALAILPYDATSMSGLVLGKKSREGDPVVQYRTNAANPRVTYLWLTQFAHWAGAEVGRIKVPKRAADGVQSLRLTGDVQQDANTAEGAVAYLVFTSGEFDYRVFTDQSEATAVAVDEVVAAGKGEKWRVYPLYAGSPITG